MPQSYKKIFQQSCKVTYTVFFRGTTTTKAENFNTTWSCLQNINNFSRKKVKFFLHHFEPALLKCLEISFKSQAESWHQLEFCAATS